MSISRTIEICTCKRSQTLPSGKCARCNRKVIDQEDAKALLGIISKVIKK